MDRLRRFWSLSHREKQLFFEAGTFLFLAHLAIKCIPFKHIETLLRARWKHVALASSYYPDEVIKPVRLSVKRAATLLVSTNPCLSRSIAEFIMLRRRGVPAIMYMGVKSSKTSLLLAHAWVLTEREVANGNTDNSVYAPLITIG
jgi:hypothetical protein